MFSNVFLVSNYEEVRLKLIPGTRWYSSGSIQLIILRVVLDVLAVCHNSVVVILNCEGSPSFCSVRTAGSRSS